MYWLERGSNSPQSPPMQGPLVLPPKPPKLVQWFWLKRLWMRPENATSRDRRELSSSSTSLPCPLSPRPSPGTVVKL
jgi:hypothetical protein